LDAGRLELLIAVMQFAYFYHTLRGAGLVEIVGVAMPCKEIPENK